MALKNDDFNDNSLDTGFWAKVEIGAGAVTEQNQRLECNHPAHGDSFGLITMDSHDLTESDIQVDVLNDTIGQLLLFITLTKVTSSYLYWEDDWYRILKNNKEDSYWVQKRKEGGGVTTIASGDWTGASGSLRITISGGTISFYEEGNLRASEAYDLSSYDCYVCFLGWGETGWLGMDYFDNFLGSSEAPPPTVGRSFGFIIG